MRHHDTVGPIGRRPLGGPPDRVPVGRGQLRAVQRHQLHRRQLHVRRLAGQAVDQVRTGTGRPLDPVGSGAGGDRSAGRDDGDAPHAPIMPDDTQPPDKIDAVMRERIDLIKGLPDSAFDKLCDQYLMGVGQMSSLVDTVLDNEGIVVVCHGLGGADDAPRRFRPSAAFGRRSRELAKHLDQQGASTQQGQQHEST